MRPRAIVPVALLALSCSATAPPPRPSAPRTPDDAGPPAVVTPAATPTPPPDARLVVAGALAGLEPVAAEAAPWVPPAVLGAVLRASGELPLPGAPERHDDRVTWALLLPASAPATAAATACAAVTADPHLACASDRVEHVGRLRDRVVVGWREPTAPSAVSRYQPLRALARLGRGVCLVSAQQTAETLDLTVRADDAPALGETLALLTVSPGLRALITVRIEPQGEALLATLSWPSGRATTADLGDDPWPTRCNGAAEIGAALPAGTLPVARSFVAGSRAQGAVLTAGRAAWVVTVGDRVARSTVRAIDATGVTVQRPGVARPLRLRWRP
ncbi:MAG: hypothetical protein Q8S73_35755 [Deltaproteobacteria bacterium]|nr:hypothetical protein [Myxococcales bacterium]MDP3219512.1 hypothetical protein [Deltaproteobacteria bacterium]